MAQCPFISPWSAFLPITLKDSEYSKSSSLSLSLSEDHTRNPLTHSSSRKTCLYFIEKWEPLSINCPSFSHPFPPQSATPGPREKKYLSSASRQRSHLCYPCLSAPTPLPKGCVPSSFVLLSSRQATPTLLALFPSQHSCPNFLPSLCVSPNFLPRPP